MFSWLLALFRFSQLSLLFHSVSCQKWLEYLSWCLLWSFKLVWEKHDGESRVGTNCGKKLVALLNVEVLQAPRCYNCCSCRTSCHRNLLQSRTESVCLSVCLCIRLEMSEKGINPAGSSCQEGGWPLAKKASYPGFITWVISCRRSFIILPARVLTDLSPSSEKLGPR